MESPSPEKIGQLSFSLDNASEPVDWRTQVPSVSDLTRRIRGQLESTFNDVWVKGEISNFKKPGSGHAYFSLKDSSAQIRAVIFKGSLSKFKFQLQDGLEILLHGKVAVYEPRGEYQIIGDAVEPVGVGALQLAFEQLKIKLGKEGLFNPQQKKPIPKLPQTIGIITSPTGAAVRDILKVLLRRFPNRRVLIIPASVQGERAAPEICKAISIAHEWNKTFTQPPIDVLIVGRGGGSLEDLWPFNEESVARAIYASSIPIISAVGHEVDITISDYVADLRAPTPSAAAELVVPVKEEWIRSVQNLSQRMLIHLKRSLEQTRLHLGHLSNRLIDPRQKLKILKEQFYQKQDLLLKTFRNRLLFSKNRLETLCQVLHTLSPLRILARGFSLTSNEEGKILQKTAQFELGMTIQTQISDGLITSRVVDIKS